MKTGAWILAMMAAAAASAQETQDPVERQLQRMREQLNLNDEQSAMVRDILRRQNAELKGVLSDEQRRRLEEGGGGGGRGRGGNGNNGGPPTIMRGGAWMPSTDELKTQLGLGDDQVSKINEIRDGSRQAIRDYFRNRPRGGNPAEDWAAFEAKSRQEVTGKIRDVLSEEQKPKFDEALKAFSTREPSPGGGDRQGGGDRRGASSAEDRVNRAMEALKIADAQEAAAVRTLVKKVADAMEKLESAQRDSRGRLEETSRNSDLSDEAVGDRLAEILKGLRELEKELTAARRELTEVVSNRQELELLRRGILR